MKNHILNVKKSIIEKMNILQLKLYVKFNVHFRTVSSLSLHRQRPRHRQLDFILISSEPAIDIFVEEAEDVLEGF